MAARCGPARGRNACEGRTSIEEKNVQSSLSDIFGTGNFSRLLVEKVEPIHRAERWRSQAKHESWDSCDIYTTSGLLMLIYSDYIWL